VKAILLVLAGAFLSTSFGALLNWFLAARSRSQSTLPIQRSPPRVNPQDRRIATAESDEVAPTYKRRRAALVAGATGVPGLVCLVAGILISPAKLPPVATLNHPSEIVLAPDGKHFYLLDTENGRLLSASFNGSASVIVGANSPGDSGDGGPALQAELNFPDGLAIGPDGAVYIADSGNHRVRAVESGRIQSFAGVGVTQVRSLGDGGPATSAVIGYVEGLAVGPDGAVYIADTDNHRIRKVMNGLISTVAGNGTAGFSGDGGPADSAELDHPEAVAVAKDGAIYIADTFNSRIRVVSPSGIITTLIGNGPQGCPLDSQEPRLPLFCPQGMAFGPDGSLYVSDTLNHRVVRIADDGNLELIAGVIGKKGFSGDGGQAKEANLAFPQGIAITGDGSLFIVDSSNNQVRRVTADGIITTIPVRVA
jgi:sugar lactone lactonase YvrE